MKKLSQKALEVLDECLSGESPEVRAKVYEILVVSELDASDPMFLVLALTGQMRVLLETAPADLSHLLTTWQEQSSQSLQSIQQAITQVKATQQQQVDRIKQTLEIVSGNCVEDIKQAGMATTEAIADANSETLSQARLTVRAATEVKNAFVALQASVEQDRQTNKQVSKGLIEQSGQSTKELTKAIKQLDGANKALVKSGQKMIWIKFTEWFSPLTALVIVLLIGAGGSWWVMSLKYNDPLNVLGRDLVNWNTDRILKCRNDNNPKCTIWVVPPEQRK